MFAPRLKRMKKQVQLNNYPTQGFTFISLSPDYSTLKGIIIGRKGTLYENANIEIDVQVPIKYPFEPPICKMVGLSFHPNIKQQGTICLQVISNRIYWSPAIMIIRILQQIMTLLQNPFMEDFCNIEAGRMYMEDRGVYQKKVASTLLKNNWMNK